MTAEKQNQPLSSSSSKDDARSSTASSRPANLLFSSGVPWVLIAVASFYGAYCSAETSFLILLYLFALVQLATTDNWRKAFYGGFAAGFLIAASRLDFFWNIFSQGAVALWIVFAFWIGLFTALARLSIRRIRAPWGWLLVPFIWIGLEYFRSELYYLRFSWLTPGYALANFQWLAPMRYVGVYGIGFLIVLIASLAVWVWQKSRFRSLCFLFLAGSMGVLLWRCATAVPEKSSSSKQVIVAGVQLEFPGDAEVVRALDRVLQKHPKTDLAVLSEYTFQGRPPKEITDWCRMNKKYLIVGGTDPAPKGNFYDTAFVVGPSGEIVFRQVKSVPIQFFKDGLPAPEQNLWDSPWGKIGLCVCYDLSYSRVTDHLVKMGAQAIIVPTMDVFDWGIRQHELHARIAPVRAAEYGIPIFRVASSGISQLVDRSGLVTAKAQCPGEGEIISGTLALAEAGTIPLDRWLARASVVLTVGFILWNIVLKLLGVKSKPKSAPGIPAPQGAIPI
ncbi:MAG: hypothetical protein C5B50_21840 [Verrucomicrobia bacterium]|nr:MAG: hypothetical protein C5B50_21840 [Verrucomicrobiota bacterium]